MITGITPASGQTLDPGDSFSFTVDETYTSMLIRIQTSTALVSAYDSSLGGAQAGYTVVVVDNGTTHTFTVSRNSGWDIDPQLIYVTENETGTVATTNISYALAAGEASFPQGSVPYNPVSTVVDHGGLGGLGDDDHTLYLLAAGTRLTNAIYLQERNTRVNTPAIGKGEVWLKDDAIQSLHFMDDTGTDSIILRTVAALDGAVCWLDGVSGKVKTVSTLSFSEAPSLLKISGQDAALALAADAGGPPALASYGKVWVDSANNNDLSFINTSANYYVMLSSQTYAADTIPTSTGTGARFQSNPTLTYATGELKVASATTNLALTERATGPANTAAYGKHWVKNVGFTSPMFTDDTGNEAEMGIRQIRIHAQASVGVVNTWYTWYNGGWAHDVLFNDGAGTGADPTNSQWMNNNLIIIEAGVLRRVRIVWGPLAAPASAQTIEWQLRAHTVTDGMTAGGTFTKVASGSDTGTTNADKRIIDLTIDNTALPANSELILYGRLTAGDTLTDIRISALIEYR